MIRRKWTLSVVLMVLAIALLPWRVQAFEFNTGNPNLRIRWDNTFNYSAAWRLRDQSSILINDINYDDGDRNFDKGLISNRLDWLSELEFKLPNSGIRFSSSGWYDQVYNEKNDNTSPLTNNNTLTAYNKFPRGTQNLHGKDLELLDAFVYTNLALGPTELNLRLGRHTVIYGETLFFGANGIAAAQGPTDLVKLLTVPSSQFKEILLPVTQVSGSLQITPDLSIGAYYQFEWRKTRIPGVGSYLSSTDFAGDGGQAIIALVPAGGKLAREVVMGRTSDIEPGSSGQGGIKVLYSLDSLGIDLGLYAARYNAKVFSGFYFDPVLTHTYREVYAQHIQSYAVSATGSIHQLNWATEIDYRRNAPLVSDPQISVGQTADNVKNILYAVGQTLHANLSGIYVFTPTALWDGGSFLAEIAWNRTLSIDRNPSALDPNTTDSAWAMRMVFTPTYFQVLPQLDLSVPIGLGYNFWGRSSAVANFNGGGSNTGDFSIGLTGKYRQVWTIGFNYVKYFGSAYSYVEPQNSTNVQLSFDQTLADRDFITFNIKRAF